MNLSRELTGRRRSQSRHELKYLSGCDVTERRRTADAVVLPTLIHDCLQWQRAGRDRSDEHLGFKVNETAMPTSRGMHFDRHRSMEHPINKDLCIEKAESSAKHTNLLSKQHTGQEASQDCYTAIRLRMPVPGTRFEIED